jgi:hypothetical protein
MGARGRVCLTIFSLGVSPFISFWLYAAPDVDQLLLALRDLQHRADAVAAAALFAALRPRAAAHARDHQLDLLHRHHDPARLGMGPYFVGIVSDKNGGDLAAAITSLNVVGPAIVLIPAVRADPHQPRRIDVLERARAGGEPV